MGTTLTPLTDALGLGRQPQVAQAAPVEAPKPPAPPTTEERAAAQNKGIEEFKLKKRAKTGRQATVLTSPLGVQDGSEFQGKTLLGQ